MPMIKAPCSTLRRSSETTAPRGDGSGVIAAGQALARVWVGKATGCHRDFGARRDCDVIAANELQAVADVGRSAPAGVDRCRDPDDLGAHPPEQQRQCAGVVGIVSEVSIEMNREHQQLG